MHLAHETRRHRFLAVLVLTFLASGLLPRIGAQVATGGLIASGESPDLFLLYTGDVIGYIEPCG